jgi:FKBP-type peptidyl-prolyl cis-trans isomerase SlyD
MFVTVDVELYDEDGTHLEEAGETVGYRHGEGFLLEGLEKALEGHGPGDEVSVLLPPEQAFGDYQPEGLFHVPREEFGDQELVPGEWITIGVSRDEDDAAEEEVEEGEFEARIVKVTDDEVVLDANHPLAGRTVLARAHVLEVKLDGP